MYVCLSSLSLSLPPSLAPSLPPSLSLCLSLSLSLSLPSSSRGLIMGIWNSHTSVGNILGTIIPSFWSDYDQDSDDDVWGWSFLVPGFIIFFFGIVTYLFLVTDPAHVGAPPPVHHLVSVPASSAV